MKGRRRGRGESNDRDRRLVHNDEEHADARQSGSSRYVPPHPDVVSVPPNTTRRTGLSGMRSSDTMDDIIREVDKYGASDKYRPTPRSTELVQESQNHWALSSSISEMDAHSELLVDDALASHSTMTTTLDAATATTSKNDASSADSREYDSRAVQSELSQDSDDECLHPPGMQYKAPKQMDKDPLAPPSMHHKNRPAPTWRFDPFAKPSIRSQEQQSQAYLTTRGTLSSGSRMSRGPLSFEMSQYHSSASGGAPSGVFRADDLSAWAEDDFARVRQKTGVLSIALSAVQLLVLMLQLALCGVAPLDVNPMVGPYPDAFSEWGGKNAYEIITNLALWRLLTPALLHVGVLHLMCNAAVQLFTCAFFEREWGSVKWFLLYVLSEAGCVVMSCVVNPDTIAVGSSGALMGLFGAKLAQSLGYNLMEVEKLPLDDTMKLEQLSSVLCMFALVSLLSFITYIDWSGHMGGLAAGFFGGMLLFCGPIVSTFERLVWGGIGLVVLVVGFACGSYHLFVEVEPDEDLSDPCEYFRNLFAEEYDCECLLLSS